ncbi:MAG: hypothetical protein AB7L28_09770, partial [Kofleriaceae bacterium]
RPLLKVMDPSVQHFISDYKGRLAEARRADNPDAPSFIYGTTDDAVASSIQHNLDAAAAAAQAVAKAAGAGSTVDPGPAGGAR